MTKKWTTRIAIGCGLLLLLLGALILYESTAFPRATFRKIETGMRKAEVYAIVGDPPGNYLTIPIVLTNDWFPHTMEYIEAERTGGQIEVWQYDRGIISIWFDASGKVIHKRFLRIRKKLPAPVEKCWDFLERQFGL